MGKNNLTRYKCLISDSSSLELYYIDDILFEDDTRLTPKMKTALILGRGGSGLARPEADSNGTWFVRRDIDLGRNIPGYSECARSR